MRDRDAEVFLAYHHATEGEARSGALDRWRGVGPVKALPNTKKLATSWLSATFIGTSKAHVRLRTLSIPGGSGKDPPLLLMAFAGSHAMIAGFLPGKPYQRRLAEPLVKHGSQGGLPLPERVLYDELRPVSLALKAPLSRPSAEVLSSLRSVSTPARSSPRDPALFPQPPWPQGCTGRPLWPR